MISSGLLGESLKWTGNLSIVNLYQYKVNSICFLNSVLTEEKAGLGYVGILDQLKGIIISPDDFDGASLLLSELPVIVVQSTEDVFVDPKNALMFRDDRLPPDRIVVKDVADSLDANAVYVSWLKVGNISLKVIFSRMKPYLHYIRLGMRLCKKKISFYSDC